MCPFCGGLVWIDYGSDYTIDTYYSCESCGMGAHQFADGLLEDGDEIQSSIPAWIGEHNELVKWVMTFNEERNIRSLTAWVPTMWQHFDPNDSLRLVIITPKLQEGRLVWERRDEPDGSNMVYPTFQAAKNPSHLEHAAIVQTVHQQPPFKLLKPR
jgi:hypothetical protein